MAVKTISKPDFGSYDKYVHTHPQGNPYLLSSWQRVLGDSYGIESVLLGCFAGEKLVGVSVVAFADSFFSKKIISLPFLNFAGILYDTTSACDELVEYLLDLSKKTERRLELRMNFQLSNRSLTQNKSDSIYTNMIISMANNPMNKVKPAAKNRYRKSADLGLNSRNILKTAKVFYDIYRENMHRLGTPHHSLKWFDSILNNVPNSFILAVGKNNRDFLASMFLIRHKNTLHAPWISCKTKGLKLYANDFLYREVINYALTNGCDFLNLERSGKGTGPYIFKQKWGAEETPLFYYQASEEKKGESISKLKKDFNWATKLWKHMPKMLTYRMGPILRKFIH